MKKLLAILLLSLSFSTVALAQSESEPLIVVSHEKVRPGQEFKFRVKGDLPYKIQPDPKFVWSMKEESGDRMVAVTAGNEPLTIIVEYSLIQMTFEEALAAPSFEDRDQMILWFKKHEKPFHDSRTVMIEGGPGPDDDEDDTDPVDPKPASFKGLTKAVAALAQNKPAPEKATVKQVYETNATLPQPSIKARAEVTSAALQSALGLNAYDDWYDFRLGLAGELTKLKASGVLTESNHAECWRAIAEGLK